MKNMTRTLTVMLVVLWLASPGPAAVPAGQAVGAALGLMPVPASVAVQEGRFRIDVGLVVAGQGPGSGRAVPPDSRAFKAAARFMSWLAAKTGLFLKQDYLASQNDVSGAGLLYHFGAVGRLEPHVDESYTLTVRPETVLLEAATDIGIIRGFATLAQLVDADEAGFFFPCVEIRDAPRFTWRGLLIDAGRHFQPVEVIKRNLDGMAAVKMNVVHWHLSEDQGFRVESKVFPRLQELGSDGQFYTQAQVRDVIAYASDRGIRVMPEFDIPGHSTSWLVAYPEYASAPGPYRIERKFGVFDPTFNPADSRVYTFFDRFFKEMAGLFPDPYMHIGGDEVKPDQWDANAGIQAFMKKHGLADAHALQAYFNLRILKMLTKHGKKMVGWDEIFQPGLPTNIVIQSWRGQKALVEAARKGYQGILSNGYYIDLCEPAASLYLNDPVPAASPLTEDEKRLVLGGEATMWAELVSPETIDSRIWPRTAAVAERLWSPQAVRNVDDIYRRLLTIDLELESVGLLQIKNRDMMLRRLAGTWDIEPLKVLAGVTEPVKRYARHEQGVTYTSLSPLTHFVDACPCESIPSRTFLANVETFLRTGDPVLALSLKESLSLWNVNHPRVLPLLAASPALREIETLSLALARATGVGLEALDLLIAGRTADKAWSEAEGKILDEAAGPKAQAELAIIPALRKLVEACAAQGTASGRR